MALNLPKKPKQSLWDKVRDTFDANTEADVYRRAVQDQQRAQAGLPTSSIAALDKRNLVTKLRDQINPLDNGMSFTNSLPTSNRSSASQIGRGLKAATLGVGRSTFGTVEGLSGLVDLVTPGTGQNRVTQLMRNTVNPTLDRIVEREGLSGGIYKGGQLGGEIAQLALTAGAATAASKSKYAAPVLSKLPQVTKGGAIGRWVASPGTIANLTQDTAIGSGQRSARGEDVSAGTIAQDALTSLAFQGAVKGATKVPGLIKQGADAAPGIARKLDPTNELRDQVKVMQKAFDVETNPTRRAQINQGIAKLNGEIRAISQGGYIKNPLANDAPQMPRGVTREDMTLYRGTNDVNTAQANPDRAIYHADTPEYAGTYGKVSNKSATGNVLTADNIHAYDNINKDLRSAVAKYLPAEEWNKLTGIEQAEINGWLNHTLEGERLSMQFNRPMPEVVKKAFNDLGIDYIRIPGDQFRGTVGKIGHQTEIIEIPKPKSAPQIKKQPTQKPVVTSKKPTTTQVSSIAQGRAVEAPKAPQAEFKPNIASTLEDNLRQIADIEGITIQESAKKLGIPNQVINAITGGKMQNVRNLNPFRLAADKTGAKLEELAQSAQAGGGSRLLTGAREVFAGTGYTGKQKQVGRALEGARANVSDIMQRFGANTKDITNKLDDNGVLNLERYFREEDYLKRVYGPDTTKIGKEALNGVEKQVVDRMESVNKIRNDINYQLGFINGDQWKKASDGSHTPRIFEFEKSTINDVVTSAIDPSIGIKRKDIGKFSDQLIETLNKNPIAGMQLRLEVALRSKAVREALDSYDAQGLLKTKAPNKEWRQLVGKKWGSSQNKFVPREIYETLTKSRQWDNGMVGAIDGVINKYQDSFAGSADRLLKSFKTTMAPGTIIGNIFSNPLMFNPGAGVNPVTAMADMARAGAQLRKGMTDGDVFRARQLGVIGGDTTRAFAQGQTSDLVTGKKSSNYLKRGQQKIAEFYGSIDDAAKLGLWNRLQKKGMSAEDAALEVAKFTQDYDNVGRVVGMLAEAPVFGKPFARFTPELIRLVKNNVTRTPHRMVAGLGLLAYITNAASKAAGETDEERASREEQVGQTLVPGTAWLNKAIGGPDRDISLNIAFGDTAVNVARAVGLNFPVEPGRDPSQALIEQLLPVEIPITENATGEKQFDTTKLVTSMLLKPIVEQVFDTNFMGRPVSDPTNQAFDSSGSVMRYTELPANDQLSNRLRAGATAYLPLGNEVDQLLSAATGEPTTTGATRTVPEALLRTVGIKTSSNAPEDRQKRLETKRFFEGRAEDVKTFLEQNKDLEQLYFSINSPTKDRETGKKVSDQISPEKWGKVQAETSGRMFNFLKEQAIKANQANPDSPVDPLFKLPTPEQTRQVLDLRSRPSGDDIEAEEILRATQPWYREFEKAESEYYKKSSAYFESLGLPDTQNSRAKEYGELYDKMYPTNTKLQDTYYQLKNQDPAVAKQFFKDNADQLSADFDAYKQQKLKYINAKRKIEGYPPIDASVFNNVTFGYEDDERKVYQELAYGKGFGGFGSGGGGKGKTINATQFLSGAPQARASVRPTVGARTTAKYRVARKSSRKPTVTIRKNKV
jgi:hypothetical protein